jgi:hypothetical protein
MCRRLVHVSCLPRLCYYKIRRSVNVAANFKSCKLSPADPGTLAAITLLLVWRVYIPARKKLL